MREKAEEELAELQNCPYLMHRPVKGLKTDSKDVEGGRCMRGRDGKFSEKERGKIRKDYIERIMNEENDLYYYVKRDPEEVQVVCVNREEVVQALNEIKTGKDPGPPQVSQKLIVACKVIGIQVMAETSQSPRWIWNAS